MLNVFPDLLSFSLFAPFLLRLALGAFFLHSGYKHTIGDKKAIKTKLEKYGLRPGEAWATLAGLVSITLGLFLIFGAFTQVAALVSTIICLLLLTLKSKEKELVNIGSGYILLLLIVSISLLLQGAGIFGLDLPL